MSTVSEQALTWVGRDFRPGVPEQCMNFVRHVLKECGSPLAGKVTTKPVDGLWTGPELASSLAGEDLGRILSARGELKSGDILFWKNTYGDWEEGTITHVGIYVGNDKFVHRPTRARPVESESLAGFWSRQFRCAMRVNDTAPAPASIEPGPAEKIVFEIVAHSGKLKGRMGNHPWVDLDSITIRGDYKGS
ncbi:MAG: C40 family peptidase [Vulcanimicrobiota bacterium]